jgi:Tfp pilus assembly protein PilX
MKSDNLKMKYPQLNHKQQGAVLLISLMILLVLTLLGLNSLNGSLLEEKMAANAQTSTTLFQAAESTIRATHLNYEATETEDEAVIDALNNVDAVPVSSVSNSDYGTDNNTVLVYKRVTGPAPNSSEGFVSLGIEIVGTASKNGIEESNTQGYNVFPFPGGNL